MKLLKRLRKRWRWIVGAMLVLLVLTECFARFVLGLGDPPLVITDPQIEYLFKPNQDCRRFHNRVQYNAFSMRSDPWTIQKPAGVLRVLFVGDSVINGGSQIDQSDLATSLLQDRLSRATGRQVQVGNASAGGWGPPNEIAWLKRFGFFDADIVVYVWSSHNYCNVHHSQFAGTPDFPTTAPVFALQEAIMRYIPLIIRHMQVNDGAPAENAAPPPAADIALATGDMRQMIDMAKAAGAKVIVVQHWQRTEQLYGLQPGHDIIAQIAKAADEDVDMGQPFAKAEKSGPSPYRDFIHPNAIGHRIFADVLEPVLLGYLQQPTKIATTQP